MIDKTKRNEGPLRSFARVIVCHRLGRPSVFILERSELIRLNLKVVVGTGAESSLVEATVAAAAAAVAMVAAGAAGNGSSISKSSGLVVMC